VKIGKIGSDIQNIFFFFLLSLKYTLKACLEFFSLSNFACPAENSPLRGLFGIFEFFQKIEQKSST
jgi:hypothetical protein